MSSVWKIGAAGESWAEAQTLESLGLSNLVRNTVASGKDTVTFEAPAALSLTADAAFTYGLEYVVWKDEARWFRGRCTTVPRAGQTNHESYLVTLEGPWWYFENCAYQQAWNVYKPDGSEIESVNKTRVILFQDAAGARLSSGDQAADVIDWIIARGAPITKGTIDAGITLPFDEQTNMSCEAVISAILRWTPDWVAWFDYTTETPTFHFRERANLSAVNLALTAASGLNITPRYDLQKPGVHITYEKTNSIDGQNYLTYSIDQAGDDEAIDCVFGVFDLQGDSRTYLHQKIVTEDFPESNDAAIKAWWKSKVPWIKAIADADLVITDHALATAIASYSRHVVEGQVQAWMDKAAVQGNVTAKITATIRDPADNSVLEVIVEQPVEFPVVATDAGTKTYHRLNDWDSGESIPTGVAAALYSAWATLHFEGSASTVAEDVAGTLAIGGKLNITGGRTEWATMATLIQSVTEDVDQGQTTIQFGPPGVIEADTLVALFRAFRGRRFSYHLKTRTDPDVDNDGPNIVVGGRVPAAVADKGNGKTERLRLPATNSDGEHDVDLNPKDIAHADPADSGNRTVKLREVLIPELDGSSLVAKRRQVLCSDSYHASVALGGGNDHSWRFTKTSDTGGMVSAGTVYIGGVAKTITSWPADGALSSVTTTIKYWIAIDFEYATATWGSGAAVPDNTSTVEYWHILTLTCADSKITGIFQPWPSDIRALLNP